MRLVFEYRTIKTLDVSASDLRKWADLFRETYHPPHGLVFLYDACWIAAEKGWLPSGLCMENYLLDDAFFNNLVDSSSSD